jgi:RimJ/RimL family protein N-acetyltransferase
MASVDLSKYKVADFERAKQLSLEVSPLVQLIPIGTWILNDHELIDSMASWRQQSMNMFFAQFESTGEKTRNYLEKASIAQSNRLLFVIFESGAVVGHLGISNANDVSAELDNVMRGVRAETPQLMQLAIQRILSWSKTELGLVEVSLKVISGNQRAIELYERCGFTISKSSALKSVISGSDVTLVECADWESNVSSRSQTMVYNLARN